MPNQTVGSSELDCGAGQLYDLYRDPVRQNVGVLTITVPPLLRCTLGVISLPYPCLSIGGAPRPQHQPRICSAAEANARRCRRWVCVCLMSVPVLSCDARLEPAWIFTLLDCCLGMIFGARIRKDLLPISGAHESGPTRETSSGTALWRFLVSMASEWHQRSIGVALKAEAFGIPKIVGCHRFPVSAHATFEYWWGKDEERLSL